MSMYDASLLPTGDDVFESTLTTGTVVGLLAEDDGGCGDCAVGVAFGLVEDGAGREGRRPAFMSSR